MFAAANRFGQKWTGATTEGGYIIAHSSCDAGGHGGCLTAVPAKLAFNDPVRGCPLPISVGESDVNILHAESRLLVTGIAAPRFQSVICSIHGLDADHGELAVTAVWDHAHCVIFEARREND